MWSQYSQKDHEAKKHVLCEGLDYSLEIIVDTMRSMHWVSMCQALC